MFTQGQNFGHLIRYSVAVIRGCCGFNYVQLQRNTNLKKIGISVNSGDLKIEMLSVVLIQN